MTSRYEKGVTVYYRKAEVEVLFDKSSNSSETDNLNSKTAAEAQVLVRAAKI